MTHTINYKLIILKKISFDNAILDSPRTQEVRLENERLQVEIAQLKSKLREPEGAVGGQNQNVSGLDLSDSNNFGISSIEKNNVRVEKLENELRIAKELIQSEWIHLGYSAHNI